MSHYDTLGVRPDASDGEIRRAYRELARHLHPDRGRSDATAMAALNEAYRVLRDPGRRAAYDAAQRPSVTRPAPVSRPGAPSTGTPSPPAPLPPARFPWKLMIGMFVAGAAFVLVAAALFERTPPRPADGLLEPGSCVEIVENGDAREVVCAEGADQRVVATLVPTANPCPAGTEAHRDQQGRGTACLHPAVVATAGP